MGMLAGVYTWLSLCGCICVCVSVSERASVSRRQLQQVVTNSYKGCAAVTEKVYFQQLAIAEASFSFMKSVSVSG